jgi:tRNA (Thr-GGU) A37 N-methylase
MQDANKLIIGIKMNFAQRLPSEETNLYLGLELPSDYTMFGDSALDIRALAQKIAYNHDLFVSVSFDDDPVEGTFLNLEFLPPAQLTDKAKLNLGPLRAGENPQVSQTAMSNTDMKVEPIGILRTKLTLPKLQTDPKNPVAEIHVYKQFIPQLSGLEQFSHLVVLLNSNRPYYQKSLESQIPTRIPADLGAFADPEAERPNPMSSALVRLLQITGDVLTVAGLTVSNDTPVFDIRPFCPNRDEADDAQVPDWAAKL